MAKLLNPREEEGDRRPYSGGRQRFAIIKATEVSNEKKHRRGIQTVPLPKIRRFLFADC
jgi:hypothetical protein